MIKKTREQEAIELGKIWMKKSIDPIFHGYNHALKDESNALEIYAEYKKRNFPGMDQIDESLIKLAVWWHDCFKALWPNGKIYYYFTEGKRSAVIFEEQVKSFIADDRRKLIAQAISEHNEVWKYRIFPWRRPPLVRIIQEADSVESIHVGNFIKSFKKKRKPHIRLFNIFLHYFLIVYLFLYPMSKPARRIYWENLRDKS